MNLYTIYDSIAQEYAPPFMGKNNEVATRCFHDTLVKTTHPEDYQLFLIAGYDTETGIVTPNPSGPAAVLQERSDD